MEKYKVVKVGWEEENKLTPIVLISKLCREHLDVSLTSPVKVVKKKGNKIVANTLAIVHPQFRQHIADGDVCTLNEKTAKLLNVKVGEFIHITKEVTESEYNRFKQGCSVSLPTLLGQIR